MKRTIALTLLFVAACVSASAQTYIGTFLVAMVSSDPSGYCTSGQGYPILVVFQTGNSYTCQNNQWGPLASSNATSIQGHPVPSPTMGYLYFNGANFVWSTGTQTWPSGSSGVPNYSGLGSWGATYNAANPIPAAFLSKIPISGGGTNGTTVQTANANLQIPGPVFPVTQYGAVGNCAPTGSTTSCTDNTTAIQAAITAAAAVEGGSVYLPINLALAPGNPTVYYVAGTLNPKGVSIYGPPGSGIWQAPGVYPKSMIRGGSGKDVFATGDPTSSGYVSPFSGFTWKDFGIDVDDSVDVSASIAGGHRWPGKTCKNDITVTNGSPDISSAGQCAFNLGDVGQHVSLTDGPTTLNTTISSTVNADDGSDGPSSAVLAANWTGSSGSAATIYVSNYGLPATARVGNCAFAVDDYSAVGTNYIASSNFENMTILTTSGGQQNNSCTFFFQGQAGWSYNNHWTNGFWRAVWGPVFGIGNQIGSGPGQAMGDTNTFTNIFNEDSYPLTEYSGNFNSIQGGQISGALWGPQFLCFAQNGGEGCPTRLKVIDEQEFELGAGSSGGWRVEGRDHIIAGATIAATGGSPAIWSAWASTCTHCLAIGTVDNNGGLNDMYFADGADVLTYVDTGFTNQCKKARWFGPDGAEPAIPQACSTVASRQANAFESTADFIASGNEAKPYKNLHDGYIWPQDMSAAFLPIIADSASESGVHLVVAPDEAGPELVVFNGSTVLIGGPTNGMNIPAQIIHACERAKLESGGPAAAGFYLFANAVPLAPGALTPLTTSYSTVCADVDLTSYAGQQFGISFGTPAGITVDVAWVSIRPWAGNVLVNGPVSANAIADTGLLSQGLIGTDASGNLVPGILPGGGTSFVLLSASIQPSLVAQNQYFGVAAVPAASTAVQLTVVGEGTESCASPPIIELIDCGAAGTTCSAPNSLGNVTMSTASNTSVTTTLNAGISAGDEIRFFVSNAFTCVTIPTIYTTVTGSS